MKCLDCGQEMTFYNVITKHGQISYDACDKCGSLWLDAGELDKMASKVQGSIEYCSEDRDGKQDARPKMCPRCEGSTLDRVKFLDYDDIILHRCDNCGGFWLSGGQLNVVDKKLSSIMPVKGSGFSDFVNHIHVPYWYKMTKKASVSQDFHLDVPPIKGSTVKGPVSDVCPDCATALHRFEAFGVEFEGCPKCKGVWLFKDELIRLKDKVEHGWLRWQNDEVENIGKTGARESSRLCVKCRKSKMFTVLFGKSSVAMDWCPHCRGIWLEKREFELITEYLTKEQGGAKPAQVEKEAMDELKRLWKGGSAGRVEELRDVYADLGALLSASIFEHPALEGLCQKVSDYAAATGI